MTAHFPTFNQIIPKPNEKLDERTAAGYVLPNFSRTVFENSAQGYTVVGE
jgi:hypothetical protein